MQEFSFLHTFWLIDCYRFMEGKKKADYDNLISLSLLWTSSFQLTFMAAPDLHNLLRKGQTEKGDKHLSWEKSSVKDLLHLWPFSFIITWINFVWKILFCFQKKLPDNPLLLLIPGAPMASNPNSNKRYKFWQNQLASMGKVINVVPINSSTSKSVINCVESMVATTRSKILEVRKFGEIGI